MDDTLLNVFTVRWEFVAFIQ